MPTIKLEDIPDAGLRWPHASGKYQTMPMGDMEIGLTRAPAGLDCTESYKDGGLPGGVCPCPHYGYMFKGKLRCVYPGVDWPDEVAETGDVYFFEAGHILIYEEETVALELNPRHALTTCMDAMARAAAKRAERAAAAEAAATE
jgi:hypothetical protein